MSDFKIEVGVKANTQELEKQITALSKTSKKIKLEASFDRAQINKALQSVQGNGDKPFKIKIDVKFTQKQVQDAFKATVKGINKGTKGDKDNPLSNVPIGFSQSQVKKALNEVFSQINEDSKFKVQVKFDATEVKREFNKAIKELPKVTVNAKVKATNTGSNTASKVTGQTKQVSKDVGDSGKSLIEKVSNWYLAQIPIRLLGSALNETKEAIMDFDSALTEFKKVSDLSGESLNNYVQELGQVGTEVARTRSEMVELAGEFKKSGFSDEDAKILAEVGAKYQNVADSEISAAESAGFITSQIRAFHLEAKDGIQIIDKVNEVSNNFSVSSTNIAQGMAKQSSAFASFGNDIDETIAMITAGTEILTNQPGKVANGLRSIGAELVKIANESGELTFKVNGANKSVALINEQTGELISTYDVLDKISSNYWNEMTEQERANLALTIGMKTQYNVLTATMSNWEQARNAYTKSVQSAGSAEKENERAVDSLNGRLNNLKATFGEIVLGSGGINNFAKTLLDVGNTIMKALNNPIARTIITVGTFTLTVKALTTAFAKLAEIKAFSGITNSIKGLKEFGTAFKIIKDTLYDKAFWNITTPLKANFEDNFSAMTKMKINAKSLGITLKELWSTISIGTKIVGGLGIALMAFTALKSYHDNEAKEKTEAYEKAKSEYDEAKQEEEKLTGELENNTKKLQDNISMMNKRSNTKMSSDDNIEKLKEENKLLENEIKFQKEIEKNKAIETYNKGKSKMGQDVLGKSRENLNYNQTLKDVIFPKTDAYVEYAQKYGYEDKSDSQLSQLGLKRASRINSSISGRSFAWESSKSELENIETVIPKIINALQDLQKEKEKLFSDKENLQLEETQDRIKSLNSALQQEKGRRDDVSKALKEQITNGENVLRYLDKDSDEYKRTAKEVNRLKKQYGDLAGTIENTSQTTNDNRDAITAFNEVPKSTS